MTANLINKNDRVRDAISSCESRVKKLYSKTSDNIQSLSSPKREHTHTQSFEWDIMARLVHERELRSLRYPDPLKQLAVEKRVANFKKTMCKKKLRKRGAVGSGFV